jgi:Tfp pilus assembly protein PilZ
VYFEFSLPGHPATVRLSGEVMWQDGSGRVGIRFVDVPKSSRRALDEWLKTNVSGRPEMEVSLSPSDKRQTGGLHSSLVAGLQLLSASAADRRNRSRQSCSIGAEVNRSTSAVPYRVLLTDLSDGGCYVQTTEPFPVGTAVEVVVWSNDEKLRLPARVQGVHPGLGMGLQFAFKTDAQREQIRQLLASQSARPNLSFQKR